MTPSIIESVEQPQIPWRSRQQAAGLLEALRTAYQTLSAEGRNRVKSDITELARIQSSNRSL